MANSEQNLDPEILNIGLELAMEWGEYWLQPIQKRLSLQFPSLSPAELSAYNKACQKAMNTGHNMARDAMRGFGLSSGSDKDEKRQKEEYAKFDSEYRKLFPWVTDKNLGRVYSQGCYYAMK